MRATIAAILIVCAAAGVWFVWSGTRSGGTRDRAGQAPPLPPVDPAEMARDPIVPINPANAEVPAAVRARGLHGVVSLELIVNEGGTVQDVVLVGGGAPEMNAVVMEAARRTRFRMPAWTRGRGPQKVMHAVAY